MGDVENDDYVAVLVRFAATPAAAGAVGTLEASRVSRRAAVRARLRDLRHRGLGHLELRADERAAALPGPRRARTPATPPSWATPALGDYGQFQPGPGNSMGYDDLKVIEAKKFLRRGHRRRAAQLHHRRAPSRPPRSSPRRSASAETGAWAQGARRSPAPPSAHGLMRRSGMSTAGEPPGRRRPGHGRPGPGDRRARRRALPVRRRRPATPTWPSPQGAIVRADARGRPGVPRPHAAAAGARPHRGRHRPGRRAGRDAPAGSPSSITPGSGTRAVAEGVLAHGAAPGQAARPADRAGPRRPLGRARRRSPDRRPRRRDASGIVGYGRIGRRVGELAAAFGMRVLAYDPFDARRPPSVACTDLDDLVAASDVLTLHVPLTPQTHHLVDAAFLARVRPGAVLVNCGRGGLLDLDAALARAASPGGSSGVGLDVFDPEPPGAPPALRPPDVVLTPHLMGLTRRATAATFADAARGRRRRARRPRAAGGRRSRLAHPPRPDGGSPLH